MSPLTASVHTYIGQGCADPRFLQQSQWCLKKAETYLHQKYIAIPTSSAPNFSASSWNRRYTEAPVILIEDVKQQKSMNFGFSDPADPLLLCHLKCLAPSVQAGATFANDTCSQASHPLPALTGNAMHTNFNFKF